jgi:phosphate transport system substrate-binding protein
MKLQRTLRLVAFAAIAALVLGLALGLAACGGGDGDAGGDTKKGGTLTGAGASFPYPLYSAWASDYNKETGVKVNYQSIGSSGGIEQIKAKTVDFGASDAPLDVAELDEAGLMQFPMCVGGVVVVYNLEGIASEALKLDGPLVADIFMGKVTNWNDPAIQEDNPDVELPDQEITVVHRADGSGTTWIFTNYLAVVSPAWESELGADKEIAWPTGVGGKGNEGVAGQVSQVSGSIGYVEYAYAKQNSIPFAQLQNQDGNFVSPSLDSFSAATANADWANTPGMGVILVDAPGADSWPIAGASFILIYKEQSDAGQAKSMLEFFDWAFKNGQSTAEGLDYVPIPDNVVELVQTMWSSDVTAGGSAVWE